MNMLSARISTKGCWVVGLISCATRDHVPRFPSLLICSASSCKPYIAPSAPPAFMATAVPVRSMVKDCASMPDLAAGAMITSMSAFSGSTLAACKAARTSSAAQRTHSSASGGSLISALTGTVNSAGSNSAATIVNSTQNVFLKKDLMDNQVTLVSGSSLSLRLGRMIQCLGNQVKCELFSRRVVTDSIESGFLITSNQPAGNQSSGSDH